MQVERYILTGLGVFIVISALALAAEKLVE